MKSYVPLFLLFLKDLPSLHTYFDLLKVLKHSILAPLPLLSPPWNSSPQTRAFSTSSWWISAWTQLVLWGSMQFHPPWVHLSLWKRTPQKCHLTMLFLGEASPGDYSKSLPIPSNHAEKSQIGDIRAARLPKFVLRQMWHWCIKNVTGSSLDKITSVTLFSLASSWLGFDASFKFWLLLKKKKNQSSCKQKCFHFSESSRRLYL